MQVVKKVGWQHLLKRSTLMGDPTVRRIRSPADLASLTPNLEIMMKLYLVMMNLQLEVAIKHCLVCVIWHYSVVRAEREGEFCAHIEQSVECSIVRDVE